MDAKQKLSRIAEIIENVDDRCMAADGPVTPTLNEMTQEEISEIYELASSYNECSTHHLLKLNDGSFSCERCGKSFGKPIGR